MHKNSINLSGLLALLLPKMDSRHGDAYARVMSRRLPLLYIAVIANTILLSWDFLPSAPKWMTIAAPALLISVALWRIHFWWYLPVRSTTEQRLLAVTRLTWSGPLVAAAYMLWALSLYRLGSVDQQSLAQNFTGMTGLVCVLCLSQSPRTSLYTALTIIVPAAIFFQLQSHPNSSLTAIGLLVMVVILLMVSAAYHNDFVEHEVHRSQLIAREREAAELAETNAKLATLDVLTGTLNRRALLERLHDELRHPAIEDSACRVHLALIDLDGFKAVNDTYGHAAGDSVILAVSRRMEIVLAGIPFGRLGGDEFAILFPATMSEEQVREHVTMLMDRMTDPVFHDNQRLAVTTSIGIYCCAPEASVSDCLECADTALYRAKEEKGSAAIFFTEDDEVRMVERRKITVTFNAAKLDEQIRLVYQPIYDADTARPVAFEALARWSPDGVQWLPPSQFVQIAEATGRIGELTRIVLEQAVNNCPVWNFGCDLSINLSANDLLRENVADELYGVVEGAGAPPQRIVFEITESALISDYERAARTLHNLRQYGFRIALDDFGTGQSSLSHVHKLPLDSIKIDQSFAFEIHRHDGARTVIGTILALARQMDMTCVIEGIETHVQRLYARHMGIRLMQGYLFGRPADAAATLALLREDTPVVARKEPRQGGMAIIRAGVQVEAGLKMHQK